MPRAAAGIPTYTRVLRIKPPGVFAWARIRRSRQPVMAHHRPGLTPFYEGLRQVGVSSGGQVCSRRETARFPPRVRAFAGSPGRPWVYSGTSLTDLPMYG